MTSECHCPWGDRGQGAGRHKKRVPSKEGTLFHEKESGGDLLSHQVALAVPSALRSLTSVFGKGTGVTSSLWPPKIYNGSNV